MTPLNVPVYNKLLQEANYDDEERRFLVDGFYNGFDIGYQGCKTRQSKSKNIPFTVGNKIELWNKIMKEVKEKRYAGPYDEVPFENYIQSPVGLVPKKGNKTRLIFHLSYCFGKMDHSDGDEELPELNERLSVNASTPCEWCSVHYQDLDDAVKNCLLVSKEAYINFKTKTIYLGKTDLSNAFRVLPLKISCLCWLVLKAEDPKNGKMKFFVDKCLPFGASISCAHYQHFSNSIRFLIAHRTGAKTITNYLDDFLFIAMLKAMCDHLISEFIKLCEMLSLPLAKEKTEWGCTRLVFLGILLDGERLILCIPLEKKNKALNLLNNLKDKKKATIKQIQVLTGYLNFLTKAIYPGRTFIRRMYAKGNQYKQGRRVLCQYHHVRLDNEFKFDCETWRTFLEMHEKTAVCRPMIDVERSTRTAKQLCFYTDVSAAKNLGMGGIFNSHWFFAKWEHSYIERNKPSIEYLELLAVMTGVLTWQDELNNIRMILYCDNKAVVDMINGQTSSCKNCMYLLRILVLNNLIHNRKLFARHLTSSENFLSDALSRMQFDCFWHLAPKNMDKFPSSLPEDIWPASKIWQKF